ncbi:hypothetical protein [Pseudoxanthomonas dokdonensis]|uniref:hypothetical protein n=1 Tax=Pseudoxanthomonas dokdonensis TaxID=344882 RepID=UPI0012ED9C55|nr:hypothetical protein [Pseudoxanthomonas dokdonensis]
MLPDFCGWLVAPVGDRDNGGRRKTFSDGSKKICIGGGHGHRQTAAIGLYPSLPGAARQAVRELATSPLRRGSRRVLSSKPDVAGQYVDGDDPQIKKRPAMSP